MAGTTTTVVQELLKGFPMPTSHEHPRIGVGAVVHRSKEDNLEVLLQRRRGVHGDGTWSAPGGALDLGEEPASAAAREALEETAVNVTVGRLIGVTNDIFPDVTGVPDMHWVTLWYDCHWLSGTARPVAAYELDAVSWHRLPDLPFPLFPPFAHLVGDVTADHDPGRHLATLLST